MQGWASWQDIPALRVLWQTAFGDSEDYMDFYFSRRFLPERTAVWREDGLPVAMATVMDVTIGDERGGYLYAVATLPPFRGRGLMRRLIGFIEQDVRQRGGTFCCLVPAEASLYDLYARLGYTADFVRYEKWMTAGEITADRVLTPCEFSRFAEKRSAFLTSVLPSVSHSNDGLRYVYDELFFSGGGVVSYEDGRHYAAWSRQDDHLCVWEDSGAAPEQTAAVLMQQTGIGKARVFSAFPREGFVCCAAGMGKYLPDPSVGLSAHFGKEGYLSLMLE